jgi:hypothetical protein
MLFLVVGGHSHEAKQTSSIYSTQNQVGLPNLDFGERCQEAVDITRATEREFGEGCEPSVGDASKKV